MMDIKLAKGTKIDSAFNSYELIAQKGQGGNAKVWRAKDENGRELAIKFLEREKGKNALKRFKNEALFCMKYTHKNIVKIEDYGTYGEKYIYYVMPLYDETLRDRINNGIAPEEAIEIFAGIISGLQFAHSNNVIHRDIKPENILLEKDSLVPVIADFGIAHFSQELLETFIETKKTERMANFNYAAPEQRKKGSVCSPQTDIFSAALILNEMFTQEVPLAADYKTIADVNKDYAFLDILFQQMFKTIPQDRLYPEDKILAELKVMLNKEENKKTRKQVSDSLDGLTAPQICEIKLISAKCKNGRLVFELSEEPPARWITTLRAGDYSHTYIDRYQPYQLEPSGDRKLSFGLRVGESTTTIKSIVEYLKKWIISTNDRYNAQIRIEADRRKKQEEERVKAELERLENEDEINDFLTSIDLS